MRIGNPLPNPSNTIQIGGLTSPQTVTTLATQTVNNGATSDIVPIANQVEVWVSNLDTTNTLFWRDTLATTQGAGTPIYPKGVVIITTRGTVRLTNNSGSNISVAVNQIGT